MNVLVLTPDRVGSTLLQRLITVYMNFHEFDRPVINLHELTMGLSSYWSDIYNQEIIAPFTRQYQSLREITELLSTANHYKTARLAHYHMVNRQDSAADQTPFYDYLNDNFFIITAQRENLFEHAISWCIQNESKRLNVYTHADKVDVFQHLYRNKIKVDPGFVINYIFKYQEYLSWVSTHFRPNAVFCYEKDLANIEQYILGLNLFRSQNKKTWKQTFDIDFSEWNKCHYLLGDLSGIGSQLPAPKQQMLLPNQVNSEKSIKMHSIAINKIDTGLSLADQKFLIDNGSNYRRAWDAINELVDRGAMPTGIPIKLQTLLEKRLLIENFDECLEVYNQYMTDPHSKINGIASTFSSENMDVICANEIKNWHSNLQLTQDDIAKMSSSKDVIMKAITS